MRIINSETGATITGEAGDNIGRGGRKRIYFKDEAAHLERSEKIEAALADNTRVQIDISSVNGLGNVFHRRREARQEWQLGRPMSKTCSNVFIMDWRDHPAKTQAWYDQRRAKAQSDGLLHVFAQEVDRNYAASVENVVIPADWVRAAIDAHFKLGFGDDGRWVGALDVADGGGDRNALAMRKGSVLKHVEEWGERDTGLTARRAVTAAKKAGSIEVQYDCIGVGSGVKAETNRLLDERLMPKTVKFVPWDAGAEPFNPGENVIKGDRDSPLNKDFYGNLKAQGWWQLRRRFENTYRAVTDGVRLNPDDLISLSSDLPLLRQLEKELSQPTASKSARMKLIIDKTPDGTRSPNIADAVMMAFWPAARAFIPYSEWL
jgi:phage terminase large subunit